jgi:signal transduction histidine kinase
MTTVSKPAGQEVDAATNGGIGQVGAPQSASLQTAYVVSAIALVAVTCSLLLQFGLRTTQAPSDIVDYSVAAVLALSVGAMAVHCLRSELLLGRLDRQLHKARATVGVAMVESRVYAEQRRAASVNVEKLNVKLAAKVDELRRAHDEIIRKGKLAQLGQLTATVAHEIRNPLGAVRTAAYLVERKIKDRDLGLEPQLARITNGIKRCDTIITELLDFARTKALNLEQVDLDKWVRDTVEEEMKALPGIVTVDLDLAAGEHSAAIDTGRMRRVIINLLTNASEAMVGKGGEVVTENPHIRISTRRVGGALELEVADNGPGIASEHLERIREPLFTTKSFGVGLGLPAVEKILEEHGGGLRVESVVSEGTRMTAWFPAERSNAA